MSEESRIVPGCIPVFGVVLVVLASIVLAPTADAQIGGSRPAARSLHQMVYHADSGRVILFGGTATFLGAAFTDMWTYDAAANKWTELIPSTLPPAAWEGRMAYDSQSDRIILYQRGETWAYDLDANAWTAMSPSTAPPTGPEGRRENPGMVYDGESDRIILFGGRVDHTNSFYDDTWAYDFEGDTWTEMQPAVRPPARILSGMAYHAALDRVILFGGYAGIPLDDTWAYDYNNDTWSQLNPATAPSPRGGIGLGMVYDPGTEDLVLYGGVDATTEQTNDETWTYDYLSDTWTQMMPDTSPGPLAWHGMVYAEAAGKIVLFGGGPDRLDLYRRETWTYDSAANIWTLVDGPEPPIASFTFSPSSPVANETVTFDASSSSDPDGQIVSFAWDFGDGGGASGAAVEHVYTAEGTYTVILTTTDDDTLVDSTSLPVVIASAPDTTNPSIAILSPADGETLSSKALTVTGSASDDTALEKVELSTDETNWVRATITDASWSGSLVLEEGENTIYARATDTSGNSARVSVIVTVDLPGPEPPRPIPNWVLPVVVGVGVAAAVAVGVLLAWRRRPQ